MQEICADDQDLTSSIGAKKGQNKVEEFEMELTSNGLGIGLKCPIIIRGVETTFNLIKSILEIIKKSSFCEYYWRQESVWEHACMRDDSKAS